MTSRLVRPTIVITSAISPTRAASVRTRVVSWKDAAEKNDSVDSDALVIPNTIGYAVAGRPPLPMTRSFSMKRNLSTCSLPS